MRYFVCILFFLLFFNFSQNAFAQSSYVLPYPSEMPGSRFYKVAQIWEEIMKYWHFGSFASFSYNLKTSDKYLVEAKTLFEYNQYQLGYNALEKSNVHFKKLSQNLLEAKKEGKSITEKQDNAKNASLKHREVLETLKRSVPKEFTWAPENSVSERLNLLSLIKKSIVLRKKVYEEVTTL